jgi:vacuolar-type H+-ATPase subunit C/Vma6
VSIHFLSKLGDTENGEELGPIMKYNTDGNMQPISIFTDRVHYNIKIASKRSNSENTPHLYLLKIIT